MLKVRNLLSIFTQVRVKSYVRAPISQYFSVLPQLGLLFLTYCHYFNVLWLFR